MKLSPSHRRKFLEQSYKETKEKMNQQERNHPVRDLVYLSCSQPIPSDQTLQLIIALLQDKQIKYFAIRNEIEKELEKSFIFLATINEAYMHQLRSKQTTRCQIEISLAATKGIHIVPVILEDKYLHRENWQGLPSAVFSEELIDFTSEQRQEKELEKLLSMIDQEQEVNEANLIESVHWHHLDERDSYVHPNMSGRDRWSGKLVRLVYRALTMVTLLVACSWLVSGLGLSIGLPPHLTTSASEVRPSRELSDLLTLPDQSPLNCLPTEDGGWICDYPSLPREHSLFDAEDSDHSNENDEEETDSKDHLPGSIEDEDEDKDHDGEDDGSLEMIREDADATAYNEKSYNEVRREEIAACGRVCRSGGIRTTTVCGVPCSGRGMTTSINYIHPSNDRDE